MTASNQTDNILNKRPLEYYLNLQYPITLYPDAEATVYTHLLINLKIMYYAPLAPQFWGEKLRKSPR